MAVPLFQDSVSGSRFLASIKELVMIRVARQWLDNKAGLLGYGVNLGYRVISNYSA
ncbi:hypothetical protein DPMN_135444 [Dreissena polymorpha]|uniref:Uncharacterized protein n=1 Tax=Dreissena polymorpha TaxID=45954 RepID=A0A9D4JBP2_DREPO|nr:hypothetical protein DPMN_135444 [Dreissena polymorpha]